MLLNRLASRVHRLHDKVIVQTGRSRETKHMLFGDTETN